MKWGLKDDLQLSYYLGEGLSAAEIGRKMGRSRCSVLGRIYRLRHPVDPKPRFVPVNKPKHDDKVLILMADGRERTTREIGREIGVSNNAIWHVLSRMRRIGHLEQTRNGVGDSPSCWKWSDL